MNVLTMINRHCHYYVFNRFTILDVIEKVLDVPPVVGPPDEYELTWHLTFRFAFATNVDLSVLDEMIVQTEDGFSMTLEMREDSAHGKIRYALRGWKNFMLQAGLENGG
ncbi:hypothetical protein Hanom_Chr13g01227791 [Helianthus anomalus]